MIDEKFRDRQLAMYMAMRHRGLGIDARDENSGAQIQQYFDLLQVPPERRNELQREIMEKTRRNVWGHKPGRQPRA